MQRIGSLTVALAMCVSGCGDDGGTDGGGGSGQAGSEQGGSGGAGGSGGSPSSVCPDGATEGVSCTEPGTTCVEAAVCCTCFDAEPCSTQWVCVDPTENLRDCPLTVPAIG